MSKPDGGVYLLGIPELDEDHLALGRIIAELEIADENDGDISEVTSIAERLVEAARSHFQHEERMMIRDDYPLLEAHRQKHRELIAFVETLCRELSTGVARLDKKLIAVLWEWELSHIDTSDRGYAEHMHRRAAWP